MKNLLFIPFLFLCQMFIGQVNNGEIIGATTKIGSLEVAQNDFPEFMLWVDAVKACTDLGNGWRLPTKDELNLIYLKKVKIGGFANKGYWSSSEGANSNAWRQDFLNGFQSIDDFNKSYFGFVRAVRTF